MKQIFGKGESYSKGSESKYFCSLKSNMDIIIGFDGKDFSYEEIVIDNAIYYKISGINCADMVWSGKLIKRFYNKELYIKKDFVKEILI
jgi:hypothetical protein